MHTVPHTVHTMIQYRFLNLKNILTYLNGLHSLQYRTIDFIFFFCFLFLCTCLSNCGWHCWQSNTRQEHVVQLYWLSYSSYFDKHWIPLKFYNFIFWTFYNEKKIMKKKSLYNYRKRIKFQEVSTVWVCLKAVIIEKTNKRENALIKVILTIITTTLLLRRFYTHID